MSRRATAEFRNTLFRPGTITERWAPLAKILSVSSTSSTVEEAATKLDTRPMQQNNKDNEIRVPEARHNLAQREAEGETLGSVGYFM